MKSLNDDRVHVHMTDVRRAEDVRSFIEAARQAWGRIDVLFSNAGNAGVVAPLAEYPEDVFDSVSGLQVRSSAHGRLRQHHHHEQCGRRHWS